MPSDSEVLSLVSLRLSDYTCVIVVAANVYDYFLTFSREVEYIWLRRWTWISIMFVMTRYVGLLWAILVVVGVSAFTAHDGKFIRMLQGEVIRLIAAWLFPIYLNVADLVMILRVYALWNRSKWILWSLLFSYVPQVILSFVFIGIYHAPGYFSVEIVRIVDVYICNDLWGKTPTLVNVYNEIPRFILGTMLLVLALMQTLKRSTEMWRATRKWQPDRYTEQLVKDGTFYFLANLLFNIVYALQPGFTINIHNVPTLFQRVYCNIALCPTVPRFIMSVRELHDRSLRGSGSMDTGFGSLSEKDSDASERTVVFVDAAQLEYDFPVPLTDLEGIPGGMDELRLGAWGDSVLG